MSVVAKGELAVLDRNGQATETIPVQFNPTTLSLQMTNSTDGGESRGRQRQQYNGSASTTLTLDLEFDTADEGSSANPVDVRTKTAKVAQFVLPGGTESKQAPPRVRFTWGTFELSGVMDSLSEELGLFSADGVPLRAKLSVSIKEQDSRFEALETGPGANGSGGAPAAGAPGAGPLDKLAGALDKVADALSGETPADFLARNGLAPEAWRALGGALDTLSGGIELEAGLSVGFSAGLSVGGGLGVSLGVQAGVGASVEASLGLQGGASAGGAGSASSQGQALAAAGGLSAATQQALTAKTSGAAASAQAAFGSGSSSGGASGSTAGGSTAGGSSSGSTSGTSGATAGSKAVGAAGSAADRAPLAAAPARLGSVSVAAAPAPPPLVADRRAATYGFGVPLRDRITPADRQVGVVGGTATTNASPWAALPPSAAQTAADKAQAATHPPCGCHRCDPGSGR